ncbi:hypothetical protein F2Q68_00006965 [Brassica cretica]|uniref:Uncharacterized protein n=1 Tax=Brassica cretica TaxID=69181 RepID=A0A8S9JM49_BRACR|nr:hypothetical protein F2Q68_00006965 [Brassica cretica]
MLQFLQLPTGTQSASKQESKDELKAGEVKETTCRRSEITASFAFHRDRIHPSNRDPYRENGSVPDNPPEETKP